MAKDLVRTRAQINQYYTMTSQLKAISMRLATATMNQNMIDALKGVNTVMANVNENMDVAGIRDVLREFAKQSDKMEMQQEMMSDQMDMVMDNGDMQEQADEVYTQILGEIGMNLNDEMVSGKGTLNKQQASANQIDTVSDSGQNNSFYLECRQRPSVSVGRFEESLIILINLQL